MYLRLTSAVFIVAVTTGLMHVPAVARSDFDFGYDGVKGPDHWQGQFEQCAGKYQSPINIEEHLVQTTQFEPLEFHGFTAIPITSTITNNGHTVMLQFNTSRKASVSGGPLRNDEYIFSQLHFHWGANDSSGSEDLINNHSFPMELHMVMFKAAYKSSEMAAQHDDGLAVMAFFFDAIDTENAAYTEIVDVLPYVVKPDTSVRLQRFITLDSLLSKNRHDYYTYHGSLTTPPCSEVVTWVDFKQPVLLSHIQIAAFRQLQSHDGLMTHNNRPTQPLGGRLVWYRSRSVGATPKSPELRTPNSVPLHAEEVRRSRSRDRRKMDEERLPYMRRRHHSNNL